MPRTRRPKTDQQQHRRRRTVTALLAAAVALGTTASACSDDPDLDPGPPAPARVASDTSPPAAQGGPTITIDQNSGVSDVDPALVAFRRYAEVLTDALRSPEDGYRQLDSLTTGAAREYLREQVNGYASDGLRLFGTPQWIVIGIRDEGPEHRHILSCENHAASYSIGADGAPSDPQNNRWEPDEHWFVLTDGEWQLEELYRGNFSCDDFI